MLPIRGRQAWQVRAVTIPLLAVLTAQLVISLAEPAVNPKAIELERGMFRVSPRQLALITTIILLITGLYVKFW
ncbi:hypothetical protein [Hymenobacter canadensis]|uniref:Uncharacterized protein n=1 Tax=Hymenobacter canadensis TaxID=2999067 RepID=A0ABY7LUP2_9BACT|nr:hypothetical protein [Hymenobacter canadensis]WBA44117.1 hypothetical protein O3303_19705 [Hymenobacter canadensis]